VRLKLVEGRGVTKILLSIHVLAAILVVGPVTVAASLFPRFARQALDGGQPGGGVVRLLHRITVSYAVVGVTIPAFGVATAVRLGVLTQSWLLVSAGLAAVAAAILAVVIVPAQRAVVRSLDTPEAPAGTRLSRLSMATGVFSLLWAVVVVLMIVRPGSTTGA
jgi:hypothetical protein